MYNFVVEFPPTNPATNGAECGFDVTLGRGKGPAVTRDHGPGDVFDMEAVESGHTVPGWEEVSSIWVTDYGVVAGQAEKFHQQA